jgi:DNA-binding NarL/FixJ family response regulator
MHPDASRRMIQSIERENPQLRLMVVTPETNSGVLRAADILGAQAVVPKSAATEVVLRRVRDILDQHFVAF